MSARLQSLPGVSTGLGSAGVRKRIGGSAGHWRLAWRQGGCWAAGRMLGGRADVGRQAALHWRKSRASGGLLACVVCLRGVRTGIGGADGRKSIGVRTGFLPFNAPDCAARWLKVFYSMDRIVTVSTSFERTIATLALPRWHDICKEPTKAKCCAPVVGSATIAWW